VSIYYSKWDLNTYKGTPYFAAHCPPEYPVNLVLLKCRAFRRLPPNLRALSALAQRWAAKHWPAVVRDIDRGYDAAGNELDLASGERLTDEQIDAQWAGTEPPDVEVTDIPVPAGGFPDPNSWQPPEEPAAEDDADDEDGPTEAQVLADIASHGRERTAWEYGVPAEQLAGIGTDRELARVILTRRRG